MPLMERCWFFAATAAVVVVVVVVVVVMGTSMKPATSKVPSPSFFGVSLDVL